MLVSTKWLSEHLHDSNIVVLAVGQKAEFDQAHIPGAQSLDYNAIGLQPGLPIVRTTWNSRR